MKRNNILLVEAFVSHGVNISTYVTREQEIKGIIRRLGPEGLGSKQSCFLLRHGFHIFLAGMRIISEKSAWVVNVASSLAFF
jgi:hypothetical protein